MSKEFYTWSLKQFKLRWRFVDKVGLNSVIKDDFEIKPPISYVLTCDIFSGQSNVNALHAFICYAM